MEYYSSVFTFDDWYLDKPVGTIAQQYDHLSRSLLVAGNRMVTSGTCLCNAATISTSC